MPTKRVLLQHRLSLRCQGRKPFAHVRHPSRQPDLCVGRNGDHIDNPRISRASASDHGHRWSASDGRLQAPSQCNCRRQVLPVAPSPPRRSPPAESTRDRTRPYPQTGDRAATQRPDWRSRQTAERPGSPTRPAPASDGRSSASRRPTRTPTAPCDERDRPWCPLCGLAHAPKSMAPRSRKNSNGGW